jgi:hypothetical protein
MRGFISFCSGAFVLIGIIVMLLGGVTMLGAFSGGLVGEGLLISAGAAVTGASITLVGGGTFLLASLDSRVENILIRYNRSLAQQASANPSAPKPALPPLPPFGKSAPEGRYITSDFREVSHIGGPVPAHLHPKDPPVVL